MWEDVHKILKHMVSSRYELHSKQYDKVSFFLSLRVNTHQITATIHRACTTWKILKIHSNLLGTTQTTTRYIYFRVNFWPRATLPSNQAVLRVRGTGRQRQTRSWLLLLLAGGLLLTSLENGLRRRQVLLLQHSTLTQPTYIWCT